MKNTPFLNISIYVLSLVILFCSSMNVEAALVKDRNWVDQRIKAFQQIETVESIGEIVEEPRLISDNFSKTFQTFRHEERKRIPNEMPNQQSDPLDDVIEEAVEVQINTKTYSDQGHQGYATETSSHTIQTSNLPKRIYRPQRRHYVPPAKAKRSGNMTLNELKAERKRIRKVLLDGNGIFLRNSHLTGVHTWGRRWKWWSKVY